ncbi:hypothetical protein SAMN05444370_104155 [Rubrimonas cliftonensis]|uniref:Uncharacterized protein n=1 Tax=Rubrimonas cliftonensis TaxID=89524 RepID=A0A1H4ACS4_9RHOB|nr:hypothetical protein SAMN05444370_104155 [Rubrimonas cliftonensis]
MAQTTSTAQRVEALQCALPGGREGAARAGRTGQGSSEAPSGHRPPSPHPGHSNGTEAPTRNLTARNRRRRPNPCRTPAENPPETVLNRNFAQREAIAPQSGRLPDFAKDSASASSRATRLSAGPLTTPCSAAPTAAATESSGPAPSVGGRAASPSAPSPRPLAAPAAVVGAARRRRLPWRGRRTRAPRALAGWRRGSAGGRRGGSRGGRPRPPAARQRRRVARAAEVSNPRSYFRRID